MEELEEKIQQAIEFLRGHLKQVLIGVGVLLLLLTAVKTIGPEEEGVVLQLGLQLRQLLDHLRVLLDRVHEVRDVQHGNARGSDRGGGNDAADGGHAQRDRKGKGLDLHCGVPCGRRDGA